MLESKMSSKNTIPKDKIEKRRPTKEELERAIKKVMHDYKRAIDSLAKR